VIGDNASASSRTAHGVFRCSSFISSGAAASAATMIVPLVISPSVTNGPRSWSGALATLSATTVCSPIAGTAPMTRMASNDPNSPNTAGARILAAITVSR
jgi:hypothetical protein